MARVTIFHTSDFHNKLTPEMAQRLQEIKASELGSLMFDCGDAISAGNIFWRPGGEPILDLMNTVPYVAMCIGNREFHFSAAGLRSKTSRAAFPVLSANLRAVKEGGLPDQIKPFAKFECDGRRIAVLGLSVPCITERMAVKKVSDYYFVQPVEAARMLVPKLRAECDLLIVLTHIGLKKDIELAEQVQGIDVILGGHTHTDAEERVGEALIYHSGFYGQYVRKLEIEFGDGTPQVQSELIPLGKA